MSPESVLSFDGGFLRVLKPEDVHDGYVTGLNDPDVNRFLELKHSTQTVESVVQFVTNDLQSQSAALWGIWEDGHPDHVGTVRIHGVEHRHRTAHIGVCLFDKRAWGGGLGRKGIAVVTCWALDNLDLRWIEAGVYAANKSSINAFLSAGYSKVCDMPDKYLLEGKPAPVVIFSARD